MLSKNLLRKLDIQDIAIFLSLYQTHNARKSADLLSVSPPTVSYSLKRLRSCLGDELFVRESTGLMPTARAVHIEPYLRSAMEAINRSAEAGPASEDETLPLELCVPEAFELLLMPKLMLAALACTPHRILHIEKLKEKLPTEGLLAGKVDLLCVPGPGAYFQLHPELERQPLFEDRFVCLAKGNTPRQITVDEYCDALHVYPSPWQSPRNMVDMWLEQLGHSRKVVAWSSNYQSCLNMLEELPCMMMLPETLLGTLRIPPGVQVHQPPLGCPNFTFDMVWAPGSDSPGRRWLRQQLLRICEQDARLTRSV
ncbi:Transcriptional regulator, LysR family [Marinobacterium lacunae]|uniref:Transcriptional regulator, LysR family n=1 Tax=Marinobacterium lacunae TaxID=1232683 RepID=A0A081G1P9_9GAMM|nr:LysR family transcriptional regulator [Marinobacterium lacunae]KEA64704.1 Transcriptional regulator, LysR family [Marinobacterium lacunae]